MSKQQQLRAFLDAGEDLINGKYILADIKIVNLLKAIASSETLVALFKNSLIDFDYEGAKKKYLVQNKYFSGDRGEFVSPTSAKDLLAFTFNLLMDFDSKRLNLSDFLSKYFFEDGSFSASYSTFVNVVMRPFVNTVKKLIDSVIEGKIQDPLEAITQEEERMAKEKEEAELQAKKERELSQKVYGESVKTVKQILLDDKTKIKKKKLAQDEMDQMILVIDKLANAVDNADADQIIYGFVAYRYMAKTHPCIFFGREKKVKKYLQDILNEVYGKDD